MPQDSFLVVLEEKAKLRLMSKSHHCVRSRRIWKNHTKIYRNGGREYSSLNVKEHDRYGIVVKDIRRYKGDTWSTGDYYRRSKQMTRNKGQSRNKYDEKDCSNLATLVENTSPHMLYIGLISIMTEGLFQLLLFLLLIILLLLLLYNWECVCVCVWSSFLWKMKEWVDSKIYRNVSLLISLDPLVLVQLINDRK